MALYGRIWLHPHITHTTIQDTHMTIHTAIESTPQNTIPSQLDSRTLKQWLCMAVHTSHIGLFTYDHTGHIYSHRLYLQNNIPSQLDSRTLKQWLCMAVHTSHIRLFTYDHTGHPYDHIPYLQNNIPSQLDSKTLKQWLCMAVHRPHIGLFIYDHTDHTYDHIHTAIENTSKTTSLVN